MARHSFYRSYIVRFTIAVVLGALLLLAVLAFGRLAYASSANWTLLVPRSNPRGRQGQAMAYDSDRNVQIFFGGFLGGPQLDNTTWERNGSGPWV